MTVFSYTHLCALTHVYTDADTCVRAHSHVCMHLHPCPCILTTCLQALTRVCVTLKMHARLRMRAYMHACLCALTRLCALTHVPTLKCVCARTRVRVCTGGLILQTNLCRGSAPPWLELPEMLWNWRRLFLPPPHPHGDYPLSWQPSRMFLSALAFPLPQVTSRLCPMVGQRLHTRPKICRGRRGVEPGR